MRSATGISAPPRSTALPEGALAPRSFLEHREVELADRFLDEAAVIIVGENLSRHLARRDHRQLGDLAADLLERTPRFGLDLLRRLLQPTLAVGLELHTHPLALRLGDAPRLGENLLGIG